MLPCFYDVYTVVVNTSCCHTSDLASWGAKKNNFQSCKQERSSRDQVNPTCDILGSYSKTSRIDFIWPIGICPTRGTLFQNDASYLWYQHLRCFVDKTTDQCWFLQSRIDVAKTAAFAADVFNDLLEVRAGRGWYFPVSIMENGCTWRFSTSMLVLSHDEKSPFLVAKPGHLGSWRKLSHAVSVENRSGISCTAGARCKIRWNIFFGLVLNPMVKYGKIKNEVFQVAYSSFLFKVAELGSVYPLNPATHSNQRQVWQNWSKHIEAN